MARHVLVAGKIHPSGIDLLRQAPGITFDYVEEVSEPSYAGRVGEADALVIRTQPLSTPTIAAASKLTIVSRHGVGYDSVDLASLNARRIALAIVGDINSVSVAEHAMMMLLACAKRALVADRSVREGGWAWRNRFDAIELGGKRLLIIGYGRIGRHLAGMAQTFGVEVRAHDPFLASSGWPAGSVGCEPDLAAGLVWADFVSVHAPKADAPFIDAAGLALMKPAAILINTARGGAVDEAALVACLETGHLAGVGLDVFEVEPPPSDHPLFRFDRVLCSPHIAGLTAECAERMAISSVQNVLDFFAGRIDPTLVVNGAVLAR